MVVACTLTSPRLSAALRDGGIDPWNLGKGDWIYQLPHAIAQCNGNVPAVTNVTSLMAYLKNQGLQYIIVKAATSDTLYPSQASPQFTRALVDEAHGAGLRIFGYNRSDGLNIPGEIAIADYVFNQGADGFVFDAESEWESQNLPNNATLAIQLCSGVRTNWPTKFLAHAPFPIISYHSSFPYKEFGYYCDAVMPQDYFIEIGVSPSYLVTWMDNEWKTWQNSLRGIWTNAIKPLVPAAQGWSSTSGTITAEQTTQFVTALKNDASPATKGGYKGVNYWVCELHPPSAWEGIRTNDIGTLPSGAPAMANVSAASIADTTATLTWTTEQSCDSVAEYGLTTSYGSTRANTTMMYYHTLQLTSLNPGTTYHYRVKSRNAANQTGVSADYVFTTRGAALPDIILDNKAAILSGTWTIGTTSTDKYGSDYAYAGTAATAASEKTATFTPTLPVAGNYDVYAWWPQGGNRSTNAPYALVYSGGSLTVKVNQQANGGQWNLLAAAKPFASGNSGSVRLSNLTGVSGAGQNVMADAVKFVYVPPPPTGPVIATQPQSQEVNQGGAATFSVVAAGTPLLFYQWRFNGVAIATATASSYTRYNVQLADAGNYSVLITNIAGRVTSSLAALTIRVPPPPHIDWIRLLPEGNARLQVSGGPGAFAIEAAPDVVTWTNLANVTEPGTTFLFTDPQT
ncbi:MAG TPA: fibronectin type III domain-containing protein, partial [Bacillota bacterium]|nr:fibronectin type III domain-containing protein [Bacillota bacterium]